MLNIWHIETEVCLFSELSNIKVVISLKGALFGGVYRLCVKHFDVGHYFCFFPLMPQC